ncbi:MAG: hypothetical protein LBM62_05205, partial [Mediterranea sp.]|nr:hypothetical protein [Mediterranea sp.]
MKSQHLMAWVVLFVLPLLLPNKSYAQYEDNGHFTIPSPQVWNFMRYGNNQASLYTGRVPVSIPIYTYEDKDFTLPISMEYASDGYKANIPTGVLGLGWALNAGGSIIREIKGIPDEESVTRSPPTMIYQGYWFYHNSTTNVGTWSSVIDNLNTLEGGSHLPLIHDNIEAESDIYHFHFLGHSGSFCLGANGAIYVYNTTQPYGEYKIVLDEFTSGIIKIETGDGYIYTFGGAGQNQIDTHNEYRRLVQGTAGGDYLGSLLLNYRITWMLSKIEAPSGRSIDFQYSYYKNYKSCRPSYNKVQWYTLTEFDDPWITQVPATQGNITQDLDVYESTQKGITLDKIIIDNSISISFNYRNKATEKIRFHNHYYNLDNALGIIDEIVVESEADNTVIRKCEFNYYTNQNSESNPITFLDQIMFSDSAIYKFDYYDKSKPFPYHGTSAIDHWGYFNKENYHGEYVGPDSLCPALNTDALYNEWVTVANREPSESGSRIGMLKQITYPTKGYTLFYYERHTYSEKVGRNLQSQCNPTLLPA